MKSLFIPLLVFIYFVPCFAGQVYVWKDENGVTHVSDKPPIAGTAGNLHEYHYQDRNVESIDANANAADRPDKKAVVKPDQDLVDKEAWDSARSSAQKEAVRSAEYERQHQVELERSRLKSQIDILKTDREQPMTIPRSNMRDQAISTLQDRLKQLDNNPEQYFYDKQQRNSRSGRFAVDPITGQVIPIISFGSQ